MPTVKIVSRPTTNKNQVVIYLRFTSNRKSHFVSLKQKVKSNDFKPNGDSYIVRTAPNAAILNGLLRNEKTRAENILLKLRFENKLITFENFKELFRPKADISFKSFADDFYNSLTDITESTRRLYLSGIKYFYRKYGDLSIADIDRNHIHELRIDLSTKGKTTSQNYLLAVKRAYKKAVEEKYSNKDAFTNLPALPKQNKDEKSAPSLTLEQLKKLYKDYLFYKNSGELGAYKKRHFPVLRQFLFGCFTGLRYSDLADLEYRHIIKEDGIWIIHKKIVKAKKKGMQKLPIPSAAYELINWDSKENSNSFNRPVFKRKGNGYSAFLDNLKQIAQLNNFEVSLTTHSARHTFGTTSRNEGASMDDIQKMLTHSDKRMTERYAKVKPKTMFNEIEKVFDKMIE